jgi:hypothetical protein
MSIPGSRPSRHRETLTRRGPEATGSPDLAGRATMAGTNETRLSPSLATGGTDASKGFVMSLPHPGAGFKVRAATGRAVLPATGPGDGRGVARLPWSRVARRVA